MYTHTHTHNLQFKGVNSGHHRQGVLYRAAAVPHPYLSPLHHISVLHRGVPWTHCWYIKGLQQIHTPPWSLTAMSQLIGKRGAGRGQAWLKTSAIALKDGFSISYFIRPASGQNLMVSSSPAYHFNTSFEGWQRWSWSWDAWIPFSNSDSVSFIAIILIFW